MQSYRQCKLSKLLSFSLRHDMSADAVPATADGFVDVARLLASRPYVSARVSKAELRFVVANCAKQRFAFSGDFAKIRAAQGHTRGDVDADAACVVVEDVAALGPLYHGTTHAALDQILASGGLSKMKRQHVHLCRFLPGDEAGASGGGGSGGSGGPGSAAGKLVSGMRPSATVAIQVDGAAAARQGLSFVRSENGVILTRGDARGMLDRALFSGVLELPSRRDILPMLAAGFPAGTFPLARP